MSQSDFVTRGQALVSSGQYQEAVKVCRLGLLGRPTTVEGRVVLGQALLALKRYDEVLAEMRVALELDHASVAAQVLRGEAQLRKGDGHGAVETLGKLRSQGLADARAAALLAEAERLASRAPPGATGPALGMIPPPDPTAFAAEQGTKNYPAQLGETAEASAFGDGGGEFTRPTSLAAPGGNRRPSPAAAPPPDVTPPPAVLAVGDRSGTVEVGTERDGHALRREDDFGDVVGPPIGDHDDLDAAATGVLDGARGSVPTSRKRSPKSSSAAAAAGAKKSRRAPMFKEEVSTVELGDDEMIELDEPPSRSAPSRTARSRPAHDFEAQERTARRVPGPGTAVRNAVKMPSGPIDLPPVAPAPPPQPPLPRPTGVTMPAQPPPPAHLAQMIASQPHVVNVAHVPPPQPPPINPRSAIASALPTAAALPIPSPQQHHMGYGQPMGQPMGMGQPMAMGQPMGQPAPHLAQTMLAQPAMAAPQLPHPSVAAAARPTIALNPQQQHSAAVVDSLFEGAEGQGGAWGRGGPMPAGSPPFGAARPGADDSSRQAHELDPQLAALNAGFGEQSSLSRSARSGGRRRSRLVLFWVLIGAAVIGGGVFAGFQIRAMRLGRQITAARDRASDLAKADTWQGWIGARDGLYSIAQASPTPDNRAAFARARGVLAFEFGDGVADARALLGRLAGQSGLDLDLATAYVALAQRDAKAARDAAERAAQEAPNDAAALYVSGQAKLLAGELKPAIADLRSAVEREPRPHYLIGLARALGDAAAWDDALGAVDRARDNPGAVIARGALLAAAGRVTGGPAGEIRAQLGKLVADGQKSGELPTAQVALADLALARVDYARGELGAARADYLASIALGLDDQRFAEESGDTLLAVGEPELASKAAILALKAWPGSRRARITLAQSYLALGKSAAAGELFTKAADAAAGPVGQTVRGQARLAAGDTDGARADFDAALKKLPGFEPAVIARSWLDLAAGDADAARRRLDKVNPKTASPGMVAVYAAVLRATGDADARDKAKALLERVASGSRGPDTARAQLELARIDRDGGDFTGARAAYAEAARAGNLEARLESGVLLIETGDPRGGRDTLDQLVKAAGDHPSAMLLLEAARARSLVGDHRGAFELLAAAEKAPGVVRWQLDRERGRLALRKGDFAGAAHALSRALDGCGGDLESFLLAADTLASDDKQTELGGKLAGLLQARLKGVPELEIIAGKLALAGNRL
ncbi:MAG TPA: tetratricopeptide repeat protein, partial [Kofleriaceae bacterium]|nr:tetratricopeptide repeat protein [Kofleriaceae bacterium]